MKHGKDPRSIDQVLDRLFWTGVLAGRRYTLELRTRQGQSPQYEKQRSPWRRAAAAGGGTGCRRRRGEGRRDGPETADAGEKTAKTTKKVGKETTDKMAGDSALAGPRQPQEEAAGSEDPDLKGLEELSNRNQAEGDARRTMEKQLDVYRDWLGITETVRPLNHYQLLRLEMFEDTADKIRAHYRKMNEHVRKYATGEFSEQSQSLLNQLAKAMLCLTDTQRKREYDASLGARSRSKDAGGRLRSICWPTRWSTRPSSKKHAALPTPSGSTSTRP